MLGCHARTYEMAAEFTLQNSHGSSLITRRYINVQFPRTARNVHSIRIEPDPVRSRKLTRIAPNQ